MTRNCPEAARLLHLFAFLNPDKILLEFLQAGSRALDENLQAVVTNSLLLDKSLSILQRFSIIKRDHQGPAIQIHRLVQDVIQLSMTEQDRLNWWDTVGKICLEAFPPVAPNGSYPTIVPEVSRTADCATFKMPRYEYGREHCKSMQPNLSVPSI